MEILFLVASLSLYAVFVVGWIWITVKAFVQEDFIWGIGCFFFFPLSLIYGMMNFDELKVPLSLAGVGVVGQTALYFLAPLLL